MKKHSFLASAIFTSLLLAGVARAADGYVTDGSGAVVRSGFGLCWRTAYWTPAAAIGECDPELAPKPAAAAKPAVLTSAPTPAPAPAKATVENLTLAADSLFVPGKATLTKKGKLRLDQLAGTLQGRRVEKITVVAHADRSGARKASQALSQKRAEAVKAYLVAKKVDASLIAVEGRGDTEPLTAQGDCKGKKGRKLAGCLAPDRRVEVSIALPR